jgi:hypothetical protein
MQKNKFLQSMDEYVRKTCQEFQGEFHEQDIVALFEEVIKFFSNADEEFKSASSMDSKELEELFIQVKTLLSLIKSLGKNANKQEIIKFLGKSLVKSFSKSKIEDDHILSKEEQERLKFLIMQMAMHQAYLKINQKVFKAQKIEAEKQKNFVNMLKSEKTQQSKSKWK